MPRIRTIKPTHWTDRELPKISLQAHLLWLASWNFSDDDGVFEGDPLLLKSQIFPRRTDIRVEQISQWLDQLVKARFIIPFTYNGESYYISRTFKTHQRIDKPQPGAIPFNELEKVFQEYSKNVLGTLKPVLDSTVGDRSGSVDGAENPPPPPKHTLDEINGFNEVVEWIKRKAPRVLRMKQPLTIEEYLKIKERFPKELIAKLLLAMHNWSKLTKERESAYLTFLSFAEREQQPAA